MPRSRKRKSQKQHIDYIPHKRKRKSAVPVAVVFFAILAFGIAWFAAGPKIIWLIVGTVAGGIAGYYTGKQMDISFSKKKE